MASTMLANSYWELEKYLEHAEEEISRTFSELCCNLNSEKQFKQQSSLLPRKPRRKKRSSRDRRRARTVELLFSRSNPDLEKPLRPLNSPCSSGNSSSSSSPNPTPVRRYRNTNCSTNYSSQNCARLSPSRLSPVPSTRSTSVRDLQNILPPLPIMSKSTGADAFSYSTPRLDFSSTDSVNRWASEILAEIDSLPGSCADLRGEGVECRKRIERDEDEDDLREAKRRLDEACSQLSLLGRPKNEPAFLSLSPNKKSETARVSTKKPASNVHKAISVQSETQESGDGDVSPSRSVVEVDLNGLRKDSKSGSKKKDSTPTFSEEQLTPTSSPRKQKPVQMSDASTSICDIDDDEVYSVPKQVGRNGNCRPPLDRNVRGVVASIIRSAETNLHQPNPQSIPVISSGHRSAFTPINPSGERAMNRTNNNNVNLPSHHHQLENSVSNNRTPVSGSAGLAGGLNNASSKNRMYPHHPCLPSLPPAPPLEPLFDPCQEEFLVRPPGYNDDDAYSEGSQPELQDAFTQTSPLSLSRSSSFTWMSDGEQDTGPMPTIDSPEYNNNRDLERMQSPADDAEGLAQFLHLADVHSMKLGQPSPSSLQPEPMQKVSPPSSGSASLADLRATNSFQEEDMAALSDASIEGLSDGCPSPKPKMEERLDESLQMLLDYSQQQQPVQSKIESRVVPKSMIIQPARKFNIAEAAEMSRSSDPVLSGKPARHCPADTGRQYPDSSVGQLPEMEISRPNQVSWTRHPLMSESIYDNVPPPSAGKAKKQQQQFLGQATTPPGGSGLSRDYSILSGQLADSESSPMTPDPSFAILDANAPTALTPDSNKSLTSSDSSFCRVNADRYSEQCRQTKDKKRNLPSDDHALMSISLQVHRDPPPPSPQPHRISPALLRGSLAADNLLRINRGQSLAANSLPSLDRTGDYEEDYPLTTAESFGLVEGKNETKRRHGPASGRAESGTNLNSQGSDSGFSSSKEKAEAEASESCRWLRAAGFPQYAQMYEAHRFPIDITAAQRDHEFLDQDSIHALFRRLHTLNRCALMKVDNNVVLRRQQEDDSEEEEDTVALSRQWRYQRKSRTWSRVGDDLELMNESRHLAIGHSRHGMQADATSGSVDSLPTGYADSSCNNSVHVMVAQAAKSRDRKYQNGENRISNHQELTANSNSLQQPARAGSRLQRSQSERIKDKARAFMRRVELIGRRKNQPQHLTNPRASSLSSPRHQQYSRDTSMHIGSPQMRPYNEPPSPYHESHPGSSLRRHIERQKRGERDGSTGSLHASPRLGQKQFHDEEGRRYGRVFMTESHYPSLVENRPMASPCSMNASMHEPVDKYVKHHAFIDKNSNIDHRIVVGSGKRSGIRTNGHLRATAGASGVTGESPPAVPLVVYNPVFPLGDRPQRPPSPAVPNSIEDLDSSPELSQRPLRVRVEQQASAINGTGAVVQPASHSSMESSDTDSPRYWEPPERRDSGVGSSLSRSPSGPLKSRTTRVTNSQQRSSRAAVQQSSPLLDLDSLSVPQLITLRQMSLLKLTALLERFATAPNSRSGPGGWPWGVQRLFRKIKSPDAKGLKDQRVFGVSLTSNVQKYGQPLPAGIQEAMQFLLQQAPESVGIFRKSGVRSRIMKLRMQAENNTEPVTYSSCQVFDVADMVKQYFRELPDPLLTSKLSETFLGIVLYIPAELQVEALQYAVLLLPDENREVLQTLLVFLNDIARMAAKNKMSAENLALCFAPSLFQLSPRVAALSPTRRHKTITGGLPNEKELREQAAAQTCFTAMIKKCDMLFTVPDHMRDRFRNEREAPLLRELGGGDYVAYLDGCVRALLKEHRDRWKGWMTEGSHMGVEMCSKKPQDGHPLKYWRCWTDVEAPPGEVLRRIIFERDVWDEQVQKWRVLQKLSNNMEIFQYTVTHMVPHPTREYIVLRSWRSELPELRGGCVLVETSVSVPSAPPLGPVRSLCLASRFLIEPSGSGRSRITYVARLDTKGRGKAWYQKVFGYRSAHQLAQLRDSFRQIAGGPETKV